ncbi:MAG: hypothetical protein ABI237_14710 [Ginsengibacter sp.]
MNRNTNILPEEWEVIERYILKQMSKEEYDAFTSKMLNDKELQNKTASVKLLLVGIQESSITEMIEDFHKGISSEEKKINHPKGNVFSMKQWMVAASVIVLVGLGTLLFFNQPNKSEKLFSEYYKTDPGLITAMSTSDNYLFEHAMIDYKTKKYDSAIKTWKELLISNPTNDTLNYFIGSAFLAKDKSDSAIPYFQKVLTIPQSYFFNDANWYLGLSFVKQQKSKEAIPYFEKSNHQNKETLLLKLKE